MKRWVLGVVALVCMAVGAWWWLHEDAAPGGADEQRSANEGAVPISALRSRWNDPITQRGSRRVTGVVLRDGQPVSGATVTALAAHGDDVLSDLPCQCDNHCGQKLLACGCAEASGQLVELLGARTGEGAPLGRATSGTDGAFAIEGLDDSKLTLWADAPGVIGWVSDIASDASDVKLNVTAGRTIKGKVTTSKDAPASGALVTAIFSEQSRFFETTTHADGTFEIGPMPKGKYAVVAMQEGLLPDHQQVDDSAEETRLELNLPRALTGVVLLDGKPVSAAKVKLDGMHRKRTVFTDSRGEFRIERLRPGEYELHAEGSGALGATKTQVNKREDREGVTIELVRGVPLDGVVVDERGAAISGVKISVSTTERDWARTESDQEGRFHLGTIPEGDCRLYAEKETFLGVEDQKVTGGGAAVTVTMMRASVLSGRVQTADGVVVPTFEISAHLLDGGSHGVGESRRRPPGSSAFHRSTDGGFSLDLATGEFEVVVDSEDFVRAETTVRTPNPELVITLQTGGSITGRVFDLSGLPAKKVSVFANADNEFKDATTDVEGRFVIRGLATRTWRLHASPGYRAKETWNARAEVQVTAGRDVTVELRPPAGAAIAGVVLDADGAPVAAARVQGQIVDDDDDRTETSTMGEAETGADGAFHLRTLPAGKVTLVASDKESRSKPVDITAPDEKVIIKLERATTVSGRVVDESGAVVKEFTVMGRPFDAEDGRFKLRASQGTQHFAIDAAGFAQRLFDAEVKEGKNDVGDIKLSRGVKLSGTVIDAKTKQPIPGALVDVATQEPHGGMFLSERRGAVRADAQGHYVITIDPSSTWAVASHDDYVISGVKIPFNAQTLDIPLRGGAVVTVSVVDAQGQPVADAQVWGVGETPRPLLPSGPPGTFVGKGFEPGEWAFRAQTRSDRITFERLTTTLTDASKSLVLHEATGGIDITFVPATPVKRMVLLPGHLGVKDVGVKLMASDLTNITNGVAKAVQPGQWTVLAADIGMLAVHHIDVTASGPAKVEFTPNWETR